MLTISLTACGADMGEFNSEDEDYSKFYDSFKDIEGLYDGGSHSYDIEDSLFNSYTVNNLDWEDEDDAVEYEEYVYIVIPFDADVVVDSFALYFKSEENVSVTISAYYFENETMKPNKIKYRSSPDTEIITVIEEGQEVQKEVEIVYDDPDWNVRVADTTFQIPADWGSIMMEYFFQPGFYDGDLHAVKDSYLYLRIENNSGHHREMNNFEFTFINFIVRAI